MIEYVEYADERGEDNASESCMRSADGDRLSN